MLHPSYIYFIQFTNIYLLTNNILMAGVKFMRNNCKNINLAQPLISCMPLNFPSCLIIKLKEKMSEMINKSRMPSVI